MNLDRGEYGLIYHRTFGKAAGREACQKGWDRWQKVLTSGSRAFVLHPHGAPVPELHANDYWAFATLGPLRFLAPSNGAPGRALVHFRNVSWLSLAQFPRDMSMQEVPGFIGLKTEIRVRSYLRA